MRIAVVGAGSWGTTLANHLALKGESVCLWAFEPEVVRSIRENHVNEMYLAGVGLEPSLECDNDLEAVIAPAELVLMVCPSHVTRAMLERMRPVLRPGVVLVNASKGIENGSLLRMSQIEAQVLGEAGLEFSHATLSGPSFAAEVARRRPTVITAASTEEATATLVQALFSSDYLRVYKHDDVIGVELGGALKNVIALATGMIEGAGLGMNTRAALITRGLVEITRLGVALGAKSSTFAGVSGLGDLVLTCTGDLSRNRSVGLRIGRGETLEAITAGSRTVAEGIRTTESAWQLARSRQVEMPITQQIYSILFQGRSVGEAVCGLMGRELRKESE
ncbi:NAD(P)-dependent glycerol-3-phosphate dehydrogenase [bacterium]|nr:NAD(P)-dependent glycerol-3-phosphate dehydrogenase [bacterium]